ncbi:MAG: serine/threonine protein kinase, partial [Deltaproteobacteria bacterium]|nr:serine/threonine protein kinase [Deltaproteobacteria bacterium]
ALDLSSQESIETNRMLGLSLQSQGLLDLAYEKFRKCPLDETMMDVVYNLGLDYERKRMPHKAVSVYEYILQKNQNYRDLNQRVAKLKKWVGPSHLVGKDGQQDGKIVIGESLDITPTVGRYEIIGELGQGAMGIVYKARDPKINRLVAIKTIRFSDEFEEGKINDIKQRFFREAEIAGKLSHRSIVAIYDVGEDYDLTYMAMEYLEGENLIKYCQKDTLLPIRKALYIVEETASALNYAHGQEVIHRDIKPANIMLLKNGRVKVTDFGIAKAVTSSETKSGIILGTPNYMSPEQINGQKIDGRSDIFSLGIVLFQLLTGQLPFHGETLTNLFYQITQVKHPSPRSINPKIPRPLEQIVDRALAKDPSERFQRAEELGKYLRALINKMDQIKAKKERQKYMAS